MLTNKYAEGYPGRRYYGGCEWVDEVEQLAIDRAKSLFGADHANVQPHAGGPANLAAYFAMLEPGDPILGLRLDHGGHLTHGLKVNFSGRLYDVHSYGVRREDSLIDFDEVERLARQHRPRLIVAGASAYPRVIDAARFRAIADEVGARLMVDMAHFSGLVAAGLHPNPVEHADVVTSTTHKTLAGPRAGLVLCREEHARGGRQGRVPGAAGRAAVPHRRGQGGVLQAGRDRGVPRVPGPHRRQRQGARGDADRRRPAAAHRRHRHPPAPARPAPDAVVGQGRRGAAGTRSSITVNRNTVPFDERPPTIASGVRIGTPAVTMRGFTEDDMREVGAIILETLDPAADLAALRRRTGELLAGRPLYSGFPHGYAVVLTAWSSSTTRWCSTSWRCCATPTRTRRTSAT